MRWKINLDMYILYIPYMGHDSLVPPPKVPHPILLIWPHSLEVLIVAWCAGCRCDHWVSSKLSLKFHWTCSCLQVHIAMPCFLWCQSVRNELGSCLSIEEMDVHHFACPTVIEIAGPSYHGASNQTALCRPQCTPLGWLVLALCFSAEGAKCHFWHCFDWEIQ